MRPWDRLRGILPDDVIAYLEDRDRELENYLDQLAGGTISMTMITEELPVFPPTLHAPTHSTGGTDPVAPADIGAATPADVAAGDAATAATAAAATLAVEGLKWMDATNTDLEARRLAAAAGAVVPGHGIQDENAAVLAQRATMSFQGEGVQATDSGTRTIVTIPAGADEALVWMDSSDKNEGLRLPVSAGGTVYDEGVLWMQGQVDQEARQRGDAANAAAAAALAAAIAAAQLGTDAQGLSYMESWDKNAGLTYPVAAAAAAGADEALVWMGDGNNDTEIRRLVGVNTTNIATAQATADAAALSALDAQAISWTDSADKNAGMILPIPVAAAGASGLDEALHWMEPGDNDPRAEATMRLAADHDAMLWMVVNP